MLDAFFSAIEPGAALAFFYAKEVPFVEDFVPALGLVVIVERITSRAQPVAWRCRAIAESAAEQR
jgi:hypothetical protein